MKVRIYPYQLYSQSARRLKEAFSTMLLKTDGNYVYKKGDIIINWGNSEVPKWMVQGAIVLNHPTAVKLAANKIKTFQTLEDQNVPHIPFTIDPAEAAEWPVVYVRHKLTGHSGEGIEVIEGGELPKAPLYTKGINNIGEYRVHVFNGEVIDYRKKSRRYEDDPSEDESKIRTLQNGWVYRQDNLKRLPRIEELAIKAIDALGLDFGAVDIVKDENKDVYVLEVNTACGLADNTLNSYIEAITKYGTN